MWLELSCILALILTPLALPHLETQHFAPLLNDGQVAFDSANTAPFNAIVAAGLQANVPIGIVFGQHQQTLCEGKRPFSIKTSSLKETLAKAVAGTGYSVKKENGVFVITAPGTTSLQRKILAHKYRAFVAGNEMTMQELGAQLTGWMWAEVGHVKGYGGSIMSSPSAERSNLSVIPSATTEAIANHIASLGSKGIWLFRSEKSNPSDPSQESISIYSYKDDLQSIKALSCNP